MALSENKNFATPVNSIFENWSSSAIIDVQLRNQCNANFEVIATYDIPATSDGCYCPETNTLVDKGIYQGVCSDG